MTTVKLEPWKVTRSRALVSERWLEVHEQQIELPQGGTIDRFHLLVAPSWTATLAVTQGDEVVLVRQYRHGLAGESLELPAGVLESGESEVAAAKRELLEETGFAAPRWEPLSSVSTEPSRHTTRAHFFCAFGAERVAEPAPDESEHLQVVLVPKQELVSLVDSGAIVHGVHVGAILLAARRGFL